MLNIQRAIVSYFSAFRAVVNLYDLGTLDINRDVSPSLRRKKMIYAIKLVPFS